MCNHLELPPVKQPLGELIRRQQAGRPLEDAESVPLLERKQGHWPGMFIFRTIKTLSNDQFVRILWYTLDVPVYPRNIFSGDGRCMKNRTRR